MIDVDDLLGGTVVPGTPFSGNYTFESTTPDSDPTDTRGIYEDAVMDLSGTVGGHAFFANGPLDITVLNDEGSGIDDLYALLGTVEIVGVSEVFFFQLRDNSATILSSDELLLIPPPLTRLDVNIFGISTQPGGVGLSGKLTSLVPEPGTLSLLGIGVLLLFKRFVVGYRVSGSAPFFAQRRVGDGRFCETFSVPESVPHLPTTLPSRSRCAALGALKPPERMGHPRCYWEV